MGEPNRVITVDRRSASPLNRQIYERVRDAIARSALAPGERLPSARSLAARLGVARGTVDTAYAVLAGEGYVVSRGAAGTFVAPELHARVIAPRAPRRRVAHRRDDGAAIGVTPRPFQMGLPAMDAFPRKLWARLAARQSRHLTAAAMTYPDPAGQWSLREEIGRYLGIARGISCAPEQIFITAGFQGAIGLITRLLLAPDDPVWLEDPGYLMVRRAMQSAGAQIVPLPVDAEGVDVAAGIRRARRARLAVITPSHQMPLGVPLSLPRRRALLDWADDVESWIVEDDYDSEFRYTGRPLPALKSFDRADRILYAGTFSKVLFPGLRLAYLVVPERLVGDFDRLAAALHPLGSSLDQAVVGEFLREGHFARHIKRMRALYRERRLALADALERQMSGRIRVELQAGGMHLLARLADDENDLRLVELAREHGLAPEALSRITIEHFGHPGLLLSFTNIPADQAPAMVGRLSAALG